MTQSLEVTCPACRLPAQRVETAVEERQYGEVFCAMITERLFVHLAENGMKKTCKEKLPRLWILTMCGLDDIQLHRANTAPLMLRQAINTLVRVG